MVELQDGELAQRVSSGDLQAYAELVRRYQAQVYNTCYRLLGERRDAEDLAQDTFIRVHQRFASYNPAMPFGPWVRRIAANLCLNHLQKRQELSMDLSQDDTLSPLPTPDADPGRPESLVEQRQLRGDLRRAILDLPPKYRMVVELRHFQELSYAEIAGELHASLSDVKTWLFRARQALARTYNNKEINGSTPNR
jgi:RNA polymerase sigma-70 factor (ECF subfamily)